MWKIDKPDLSRAKGKDVRELIANCDELDDTLKKPLKELYQQYDDQHGSVTEVQLSAIADDKAKAIHGMYKSTYENKPLAYIRDELTAKVYKCPYCGIAQPNTLDHYMPESKYEALAVCRMNLVPMCGVCNNYKHAKPYEKFVHCYYETLPTQKLFLVAKVCIISLSRMQSAKISYFCRRWAFRPCRSSRWFSKPLYTRALLISNKEKMEVKRLFDILPYRQEH